MFVPDELKTLARWVPWDLKPGPGDKPTKVPRGKTNDPRTWLTFDAAVAAGGSGVGFVFTGSEYTGVDLDGCFHEGTLSADARAVVEGLTSYTEVSPSGTGLHIIVRGALPEGSGHKNVRVPGMKALEAYDAASPRFFTWTGQVFEQHDTVAARPVELAALATKWLGRSTDAKPLTEAEARDRLPVLNADLSDADVLALIAQEEPTQYRHYIDGDLPLPRTDKSQDDAVLLRLLIDYVGWDEARLVALAEQSALRRPKWKELRSGTPWLAYQIRRELKAAAAKPRAPTAAKVPWVFYTDQELLTLPEPEWLAKDMLFQGGLTLLYGLKGSYKSFVALTLANVVAFTKGPVVYVVAEGKGHFGKRVAALRGHLGADGGDLRYCPVPVNLFNGDVERFLAHVKRAYPDGPRLFVFDTLARSAAGAEENSAKDMGLIVQAAQRLQQECDAAVLLVHHTGKDGLDARGSGALKNAADIVLRLDRGQEPLTTVLTFENTKDLAEPDPILWVLKPWKGSLVALSMSQGPEVTAAPPKEQRPTLDDERTSLVKRCWDAPRTKDELAAETGRSTRWLEQNLPVLVAAGRLKAEKRAGKGGPLEYLATRTPIDTI